jgi:hypothetical protein
MNPQNVQRRVKRDLAPFELELKNKLLNFYNKKIKPVSQSSTIDNLKSAYKAETILMIGDIVERIHDYVMENNKFNTFSPKLDGITVEEITLECVEEVWNTIGRLHRRETEYKVDKTGELQKKAPFDRNAAMVGISALIVFRAYNTSLLRKMSEIVRRQ